MRLEDWPERLDAALRRWAATPFDRERTDCVEYAIDVIASLTGRMIENPMKGKYTDERSAARCILSRWSSLASAVTDFMGKPIPVSYAQRGDLVIRGNNLGICRGEVAAFRSLEGLVDVPISDCAHAWRVE